MNLEESINHLIKNRRSVFPPMFTGEKIDDKVVHALLENANWAPTHKKTEPWRYIVFKDQGLNALSDFCTNAYKSIVPEEKFSQRKFDKTKKKILGSSHVIAICMNRSIDVQIPEWEEIASVAASVQNLWLSCLAYGVGGYWSSPKYISEANDFLNLDENQRCLGFFYLGVPNAENKIESERGDINEKVKWRSE